MEEVTHFKEIINTFIDNKLKMQLDSDKTQITQTTKGFNFLGFTYKMASHKSMKSSKVIVKNKYSTNRVIKRTTSRITTITPDKQRILKNLTLRGYCDPNHKPISVPKYIPLSDFETVLHYNQVGIFNYYRFIPNLSIINYTFYILKFSCAKTLARKKKQSISKIFTQLGSNIEASISLTTNGRIHDRNIKLPTITKLKSRNFKTSSHKDYDPFYVQTFWRTSVKVYGNCCICGSTEDVAMHHLNSLKKLKQSKSKQKTNMYIRSVLGRKQIPVCKKCHLDITNGIYDELSPIKLYSEFLAKL